MRAFARQPEPAFWGAHERRWLYETTGVSADPLRWRVDGQTLAERFHERVRADGEPRRCAYCDGPLGAESRTTIDHFIPQSECRWLVLTWENLYPACDGCNSGHKRTRWSCRLLRPDVDPVERWVEFEAETGRLAPAPDLDPLNRARVRLTLGVLGLNTTERCKARQGILRALENARRSGDTAEEAALARHGPYRFVAKQFLASRPRFGVLV